MAPDSLHSAAQPAAPPSRTDDQDTARNRAASLLMKARLQKKIDPTNRSASLDTAPKDRKQGGLHESFERLARASQISARTATKQSQSLSLTHGGRSVSFKEHFRQKNDNVQAVKKRSGVSGGSRARGSAPDVHQISPTNPSTALQEIPVTDRAAVPRLAHGLSRVLFNPGVYHLRDPRSRVYNFDPYLETVLPVSDFDFDAVAKYTTSSQDQTLNELAKRQGKKYTGSTSSMTSTLSHFHYLLSSWRPISLDNLSKNFPLRTASFSVISRAPTAIFLRWKNGTYAIDQDKQFDFSNILSMLGRSMEKFLTLGPEEYGRYQKGSTNPLAVGERESPETYNYSTLGDFLMRSQLDAYDPRLPGTGMFDLKTRAVLSIRMQANDHEQGLGYEIKNRFGELESYEREYFDMTRAAFMKYSLQVRIGRMDGIFVAFHNVERIFGFQYISIDEMDAALHGPENEGLGDQEFRISVHLLNQVFDRVTKRFPKQSVRLHFETREGKSPFMYIFAEPQTEAEIHDIQNVNRARVRETEEAILNPQRQEYHNPTNDEEARGSSGTGTESDDFELAANVEEQIMQDESEALQERTAEGHTNDALSEDDGTEQAAPTDSNASTAQSIAGDERSSGHRDGSRVAQAYEPDQASEQEDQSTVTPSELGSSAETDGSAEQHQGSAASDEEPQLLAFVLTIRNKVNGLLVDRPEAMKSNDQWKIEYSFKEIDDARAAWTLYEACQARRKKAVDTATAGQNRDLFITRLRELAKQGREYRKKLDEEEQKAGREAIVLDS